MAEPWVINASPVILLAEAGLIDLLPRVAGPLVIPSAVAEEIRRGPSTDAGLRWLNAAGREFVRPPVPVPPSLSQALIGQGERAVIAWALTHSGFTAVLDDRVARTLAQQMGVPVIGSAGVLLRLKAAGLIARVTRHLDDIRRAGSHMSDALYRQILCDAGEAPPSSGST